MGKRKSSSDSGISDREILAMYEAVLRLLYDNPEKIDPPQRIREYLQAILPFDHYHYMIKGTADEPPARMQLNLDKKATEVRSATTDISISQSFEEEVEQEYRDAVRSFHETFGGRQSFDYYRVVSEEGNIRVMAGLFRCRDAAGQGGFSEAEKRLLDRLAPHICLLYRMIMLQLYQQESVYYFGTFSKLASNLVKQHDLSDAEVAIVPDLIFGYTNDAIADRHFISLATVKSHINHILKKTGTKNRIDFISKFFTSPERVQL